MPKICSYVINVKYPNKKDFYIGSFTVEGCPNKKETEDKALAEASGSIKEFFQDCFPENFFSPGIIKIILGSVVFVPDEFKV
jgi:hypothetical protein